MQHISEDSHGPFCLQKAFPFASFILMHKVFVKYDSDEQVWVCLCPSVFVFVCGTTEAKQEETQKMNMLYGSSKILHGPSAREEPRAECLWLPNIINYLCAFTSSCCVWPAMSFRSRTCVRLAYLFMNTNYRSVSLSLNVSSLFPASSCLLVRSGAAV